MIAHGREQDAAAYLDWAAKQGITVVRVLLMAHHLFQLSPADGLRAAPRLLELAGERGLHVELVALADTKEIETDLEAHVKAVGTIAASHPNAIVEIANEPWHGTQDKRLHDPARVRQLAALVPSAVPVALGSAERDAGYAAAGSYATWHSPRHSGEDGWGHVLAQARGVALESAWNKPVVSDEPMGAHSKLQPGRRDNSPERFGALGALTRFAGLGATFHYEGGLQAEIPAGVELACFNAWREGLDLVRGLPDGAKFVQGPELEQLVDVKARAAFAREAHDELWVLAIDPAPEASATFRGGWTLQDTRAAPGVRLYRARR